MGENMNEIEKLFKFDSNTFTIFIVEYIYDFYSRTKICGL